MRIKAMIKQDYKNFENALFSWSKGLHIIKVVFDPKTQMLHSKARKGIESIVNSCYNNKTLSKNDSLNKVLETSGDVMGVDFYTLNSKGSNYSYIFQIWLLNPNQRFDHVRKEFYKGSGAVIPVSTYSDLKYFFDYSSVKQVIIKEMNTNSSKSVP